MMEGNEPTYSPVYEKPGLPVLLIDLEPWNYWWEKKKLSSKCWDVTILFWIWGTWSWMSSIDIANEILALKEGNHKISP
jgi:hypothetical protein